MRLRLIRFLNTAKYVLLAFIFTTALQTIRATEVVSEVLESSEEGIVTLIRLNNTPIAITLVKEKKCHSLTVIPHPQVTLFTMESEASNIFHTPVLYFILNGPQKRRVYLLFEGANWRLASASEASRVEELFTGWTLKLSPSEHSVIHLNDTAVPYCP